mmetsp:Transcript_118746/g.368947  ORF Transcript_118746/g.368947 Transcript_118746/m.368947 type:complete len:299 (-) Transcript_118746:1158-2054(-)
MCSARLPFSTAPNSPSPKPKKLSKTLLLLILPLFAAPSSTAVLCASSTASNARWCARCRAVACVGFRGRATASGPQMALCQHSSNSCKASCRAASLAAQAALAARSRSPRLSRAANASSSAAVRVASCASTAREACAARSKVSRRSAASWPRSWASCSCCASSPETRARLACSSCSRSCSSASAASATASSSPTAVSCAVSSSQRAASSARCARMSSTCAATRARFSCTATSSDSMASLLVAICPWMRSMSSPDSTTRLRSAAARSWASLRKAGTKPAAARRGGSLSAWPATMSPDFL